MSYLRSSSIVTAGYLYLAIAKSCEVFSHFPHNPLIVVLSFKSAVFKFLAFLVFFQKDRSLGVYSIAPDRSGKWLK